MPSTKIRSLEEKDFPELADLLKEGLLVPPEIWQRRFDMWWLDNPLADESIPYGWVIEEEREGIVGFLGNIPVKYQIKGKDGIAAAGTSLYVRPSVRGVTSLQLILSFERQKNIKLLLHTTPNEKATEIYSRFGSCELDVPYKDMEYWYIRDYGKMLDFYARTKTESNILLSLIKVSLIPVKLISPFIQWFTDKRKFKVQTDHYKCFLCTDCDDSFTELWKKNRKEKTTTISRDAKTLKWLYFSEAVAEKRHVIKCTDTRNDELLGYFVVDIEYPEKDIKIMQLKDAYIPKFKEGILLSLIAFSIDMSKRHNVAGTLFWSIDQEMDEIMKKRIRVKRKHKRTYMYHFVNQDNSCDPQEGEEEEDKFIPSPIDPDRGVL